MAEQTTLQGIESLFLKIQQRQIELGGIEYSSAHWTRLQHLASACGFRQCYEGESCEGYIWKFRQYAARMHRDDLYAIANNLAFQNDSLLMPPEQGKDNESDIAALATWCIKFKRTIPPPATRDSFESIAKLVPPLDTNSYQWAKNSLACELDGLDIESLARYRNEGETAPDKMMGRDKDGRIWRRKGTPRTHPWYLRNSLKYLQSKPQKPD